MGQLLPRSAFGERRTYARGPLFRSPLDLGLFAETPQAEGVVHGRCNAAPQQRVAQLADTSGSNHVQRVERSGVVLGEEQHLLPLQEEWSDQEVRKERSQHRRGRGYPLAILALPRWSTWSKPCVCVRASRGHRLGDNSSTGQTSKLGRSSFSR